MKKRNNNNKKQENIGFFFLPFRFLDVSWFGQHLTIFSFQLLPYSFLNRPLRSCFLMPGVLKPKICSFFPGSSYLTENNVNYNFWFSETASSFFSIRRVKLVRPLQNAQPYRMAISDLAHVEILRTDLSKLGPRTGHGKPCLVADFSKFLRIRICH